jgi:hypothetical protein
LVATLGADILSPLLDVTEVVYVEYCTFCEVYLIYYLKNGKSVQVYTTLNTGTLTYGSQVWQIPTKEINELLATEMDFLRRLAGISRMDKVRNRKIRKL